MTYPALVRPDSLLLLSLQSVIFAALHSRDRPDHSDFALSLQRRLEDIEVTNTEVSECFLGFLSQWTCARKVFWDLFCFFTQNCVNVCCVYIYVCLYVCTFVVLCICTCVCIGLCAYFGSPERGDPSFSSSLSLGAISLLINWEYCLYYLLWFLQLVYTLNSSFMRNTSEYNFIDDGTEDFIVGDGKADPSR